MPFADVVAERRAEWHEPCPALPSATNDIWRVQERSASPPGAADPVGDPEPGPHCHVRAIDGTVVVV